MILTKNVFNFCFCQNLATDKFNFYFFIADKGICKLFAVRKSSKCNKNINNKIQDIEVGVGNKHGPIWIWDFLNETHGDLLWGRKGVQIRT